ncbi:MAG: zinc-binding dehydrogenase [Deltaproteobacteria bacterium]|nr:zinc-binding dehydrogenase [Deltaproteobacteria bacterium]MBI2364713.1 zinc-binding dehydrogenase [Deltaproteobacteria bacterium]
MKAIRIHQFGPTEEALQYEEVPTPEPGSGELLIKVEAASLNRADIGLRKGTYRISADALPIIPGREFAGAVARVGANVSEFNVGQRVVAYPSLGGYAEYAVAKASEVRPVPDGVSSTQAAALPTVFLTAWFGLLEDGKLKAGEWLLVQAGSSGVGNAAIQIGKHLGAKVITTSSSEEKCRRLRQLGADVTIDVSQNDFVPEVMRVTGNRGVDVVLEMIGGEVYQKSLQVLAPGGRLFSIGGAFGAIPDPPPPLTEGRKASRFSITNYLKAKPQDFRQLDAILKLVREKKFQVVIGKTFPLAETRAAQRYLEGREHFGKIVLTM